MDTLPLIKELLQVPNALSLMGVIISAFAFIAGLWFYHSPRKLGFYAVAKLPLFSLNSSELLCTVTITNTNTRQFQIKKIGFETFGRDIVSGKTCSHEASYTATMLTPEKLLLTEGESTTITFDGYKIASEIADGLRRANVTLTSPELKIWLYITHGRRFLAKNDAELSEKLTQKIIAIAASAT